MAAFGGMQITNRGRALQAKAQAGAQLQFTRLRIGSGSLSGQQIADLTGLIAPQKWLTINKSQTRPDGKFIVGAPMSNTDIATGFYFREIGVFAQDPDIGEILYCYANAGSGAEYIPAGGGPDIVEKQIDVITLIGNAANASATIDQSLVFVTVIDFNAHKNAAVLDHPDASVTTPKLAPKSVTAAKIADKAVGSGQLTNGAATDTIIGNRTVDDTATPDTGPNTITNLFSFFGKMVKLLSGESSWVTAPAMTLRQVYNKFLGTGHKHTGADGDGPKIDSTGLADGAATDAIIGNRTITDTTAAAAGADSVTGLFSKLGNMIKAITGKANWFTAPATNLEAVKAHMDAALLKSGGDIFGNFSAYGYEMPHSVSPPIDLAGIPEDRIYFGRVNNKTGYPGTSSGSLIGYRWNVAGDYQYSWQIFHGYEDISYIRYATPLNTWGPWEKILTSGRAITDTLKVQRNGTFVEFSRVDNPKEQMMITFDTDKNRGVILAIEQDVAFRDFWINPSATAGAGTEVYIGAPEYKVWHSGNSNFLDKNIILPEGADVNAIVLAGNYAVGSSWVGSPFPGSFVSNQGYVQHYQWTMNNLYAMQVHTEVNLNKRRRYRIKDNGVWGDWITIWTSNNMGAGSGLSSDTLRGFRPDYAWNGDTIPIRNPDGSIHAAHYNSVNGYYGTDGRLIAHIAGDNTVRLGGPDNNIFNYAGNTIFHSGHTPARLEGTGYTRLPNGVIIQWGSVAATLGNTAVFFPIAFPTACASVQLTSTAGAYPCGVNNKGVDVFYAASSGAQTIHWFAIGY